MAARLTTSGVDLSIEQDWIDVTSGLPTPNEQWTYTDRQGHEHRYARGYPTLDLIIDASHWCDGHEGPWNHDPHEAIDESHYECRICRQVIEPTMDPPGTPKQIAGMRTMTLTVTDDNGFTTVAYLLPEEAEALFAVAEEGRRHAAVLLVAAVPPERIIERRFASR